MSDDFVRYVLAPTAAAGPLPWQRADVYRDLVRESLRAVIVNAFPVSGEILGAEAFEQLFSDFLAAGGPQTSFYRDVPGDLVSWALDVEQPLSDLLHYEWLELLAARHPADLDQPATPTDGSVHVNPTMQLGVYRRPVHQMCRAEPAPAPFPIPNTYLVWRRPITDEVVFHRAGLLIGRAIELAAEAPLSLEALVLRLTREAEGVGSHVIRASLERTFAEIAERDGLEWSNRST